MVVETCGGGEQDVMDSMDEDDMPIVFKRKSLTNSSSAANKQNNQLNSKSSSVSQRPPDRQSGGRPAASDVRSPQNGQSSSVVQKGKTVLHSSSKSPPPVKSPLASPNPCNSSAKASEVKNSKPSTDDDADERTADDSEDDKPLSARVSAGLSKAKSSTQDSKVSNAGHKPGSIPKPEEKSDDEGPLQFRRKSTIASKVSNASTVGARPVVPPKPEEESDDDKPIQFIRKPTPASKVSNASTVGARPVVRPKPEEESDDEKPLQLKVQVKSNNLGGASTSSKDKQKSVPAKNGSSSSPLTERKPSTVLKRPAADGVAGQSNLKKTKLSADASTTTPPPSNNKNKEAASVKAEKRNAEDDEDHIPISQRMKKPTSSSDKKSSVVKKPTSSSVTKKIIKKSKKVTKNNTKYVKSSRVPPGSGEGKKWTTLVHNGVIFPPPYKPHGVKLLYKGKPVDLTPEQEEVATMYAVMLDTDYMSKPKFKENFMTDWKKLLGKNHIIKSLEDCDFTPIYEWHQKEKEKKKQMTTDEKKALKEDKMKQEEKYMWAIVDGVKEKVGNFRVEPPGLFRGRGEHPKMGKLKKRIRPSDITINIGKDAPIPECPIPGQSWKEIRHDNTVTWLAFWLDPINQKEFKYVFLAASSTLKGQSDKEKYEKARLLKDYILGIRAAYTKGFASKDPTKKQIAVATYLIDKLALRAGNEKDDDEADTVGCCTLKVENVEPMPPNILKFDFLGKDSIRYQNEVKVEIDVFKAIQQFRTGKKGGDDLFDMLDTSKLNAHLKELMPGLTAKVFRTYNASITLDDKLTETKPGDLADKVATYNHANKQVAIICNHQRAVSKTHDAQMSRLDEKIKELKDAMEELKTDLARAKKGKPPLNGADGKPKRNLNPDALERKISQTTAKIDKMERDKESKEDLKTVALGTSKINYLDPRITVAWCKRHEVPIEKMFNKSLLAKFAWAMDVDPEFRF